MHARFVIRAARACDNRATMTADDFRRLALDLNDAVEAAHMGHPDFRVNGRIFATLDRREEFGVVALSPEEQNAMRRESAAFEPAAGAWGRQGSTVVRLPDVGEALVRDALTAAREHAAAAPPPRGARRAK